MTRQDKINFLQAVQSGEAHPDTLEPLGGVYIVPKNADGYFHVDGAKWGYPERLNAATFAQYQQRIEQYNERRRVANMTPMTLIICPE